MTLAILLLAAGKGTRMNSKYQKILHEVGGKPMIVHAFETAVAVADLPPLLVISPDETQLQPLLGNQASFVVQPEPLGTGHAAQMGASLLRDKSDQVLITYGDMPLLRPETAVRLADAQRENQAVISLLTVMGEPSSSFGRIVRHTDGRVLEIVEVAEASQRSDPSRWLDIRELNAGVYCFDAEWLWAHVDQLPLRQARSGPEYYLTDLIETAVSQGQRVAAMVVEDADECLGAGTRQELALVEQAFRRRAVRRWLNRGVTIIDPAHTYIDQDVQIGQDTVIWPNSFIQDGSIIGEDCVIGPNTIVRAATIGNHCWLEQVVVDGVTIPAKTAVPPFAHRSPET